MAGIGIMLAFGFALYLKKEGKEEAAEKIKGQLKDLIAKHFGNVSVVDFEGTSEVEMMAKHIEALRNRAKSEGRELNNDEAGEIIDISQKIKELGYRYEGGKLTKITEEAASV